MLYDFSFEDGLPKLYVRKCGEVENPTFSLYLTKATQMSTDHYRFCFLLKQKQGLFLAYSHFGDRVRSW